MQYTVAKEKVFSTGEHKGFNMAINAKSFSILTSGIYQNKIKAVIREYSTNALDSHIEANNPDPFDVHLPTNEEPYFYVQDYGVGLSEDQFEEVFFTFFESTKDKSNAYNGTLGLGSKVFASYNTKSCIIQSIKDGVMYVYSCFIGKDGIPEYSKISESHTYEPNGLKVQIPVDKKDIDTFEYEARDIYQWFDRKPNFIGKTIDIEDRSFKDYTTDVVGCYAIMGNVCYPINANIKIDKLFTNSYIAIRFKNGELNFLPSRESLQYDERTIKNINNKISYIKDLISKEIEESIANSKSDWEARINYSKISKYKYVHFAKNVSVNFNNKTLNHAACRIELDKPVRLLYSGKRNPRFTQTLYIEHAYHFVLNDLKTGTISRTKNYLSKNHITNCYILERSDIDNLPISYDESCFILASSLDKTEIVRSSYQRGKLGKINLMIRDYFPTKSWKEVELSSLENEKNKYYIFKNGYNCKLKDKQYVPREIFKLLDDLGINVNLYGVLEKNEKLLKDSGFDNISTLIEAKFTSLKNEIDKNLDFICECETINSLYNSYSYTIDRILGAIKKYNITDIDACEIANKIKEFKQNKKKYEDYKNIISCLNKHTDNFIEIKINKDLYISLEKCIEKYNVNKYNSIEILYYLILGVNSK